MPRLRVLRAGPGAEPTGRGSRRLPRLLVAALLLGGLAAAVAGCGAPIAQRRPNLVLVSIDTLRADHLGCYGYRRPTTPSLDAFRGEAILARQTVAQATSTLPAHASLFTSLIPQHHGASHTHDLPLAPEATTLAEVLSADGYQTLAAVGSAQMLSAYGLAQGFETYAELPSDLPFRATVDRGLELLDRRRPGPFLLFLHTYEVHHPYEPRRQFLSLVDSRYLTGDLPSYSPEQLWELSQRQDLPAATLQSVIDAYDGEIRSMDAAFGALIAGLRSRGLLADSVVVFTSDHGEELGEHGYVGWHSHTLYDELLVVPLLIRLPGGANAGATIDPTIRQIDVAPTLLALAGIPPPAEFEGRDVLTLLRRRREEVVLPAVLARERMPYETGRFWGIREGRWKLAGGQLFDLLEDPGEHLDARTRRPDVARRLGSALAAAVTSRPPLRAEEVTLDEAALESLRSLGYLH